MHAAAVAGRNRLSPWRRRRQRLSVASRPTSLAPTRCMFESERAREPFKAEAGETITAPRHAPQPRFVRESRETILFQAFLEPAGLLNVAVMPKQVPAAVAGVNITLGRPTEAGAPPIILPAVPKSDSARLGATATKEALDFANDRDVCCTYSHSAERKTFVAVLTCHRAIPEALSVESRARSGVQLALLSAEVARRHVVHVLYTRQLHTPQLQLVRSSAAGIYCGNLLSATTTTQRVSSSRGREKRTVFNCGYCSEGSNFATSLALTKAIIILWPPKLVGSGSSAGPGNWDVLKELAL